MGKALLIASTGATLSSGNEFNLFGYSAVTSIEGNTQISCTEAATFSNLRASTRLGNSGTATYRFRDAGADGNQTFNIIGSPVSGEDTTNTDVLAAADLFNISYVDTGSNSTNNWIVGNVEFSSGHGNFHAAANYGGVIHDVGSSTRFIGLWGGLPADGQTDEDAIEWKTRAYDTFDALQVRCILNARVNTSSFINRINGNNGTGLVEFTSGATGLVSDTAIGDAITDGQTINISITLGAGLEDLSLCFVCGTLKSSANKSETIYSNQTGRARTASTTEHYVPIGGSDQVLGTFTEAQARIKPGFAAVVSNLRCYLSDNTYTGNGTLKLYQNGVAVITTTITASGGAGWYENSSDTITIDADDELSFGFDEGTSGSITLRSAGIMFAPVSEVTQAFMMFPPRTDGLGRGGIFPGNRVL